MAGKLREITVAMDHSDYSLCAARWAVYLANRTGAAITLVHILDQRFINSALIADISAAVGMTPVEHAYDHYRAALEERAKTTIAAGTRICQYVGIKPRSHIVPGIFQERIVEFTENSNLLVLGRRGDHSGFGSHLLGSDGEKAVRHVNCSCLVVPEEYHPIKRVVVGVDDSGPARSAVHWAEFLCELSPDLEIIPINVLEDENDDKSRISKNVAGQLVKQYCGDPENIIISECRVNADLTLCIVGATGHSRTLKEIILGTISSHLIHKLTCPLLLAR